MDIIELIKKEANRRRLSPRTIETYCFCVNKFLKYACKEPKKITKADVKSFLDYLSERGKSGSTMNVYQNSIRFMTEEVLFKSWNLNIKYSKRPKTLPTVLTKEETKRLFDSITNEKHKLIVMLMYSSGLRINELVNLKVKDLCFESMQGFVRKGKGGKDRVFVIAQKIKNELIALIKNESLDYGDYLFKTRLGHISKRTVYEIVKTAAKNAGIMKNVHPHTLRHSFATHLVENDCDILLVQALMGHTRLETTNVYVHVANPKMLSVKSPLDGL